MQAASYKVLCADLGKLAKMYDVAAAQADELETTLAALADQSATNQKSEQGSTALFGRTLDQFASAIATGPSGVMAAAQGLAKQLFLLAETRARFASALSPNGSMKYYLDALVTEMTNDSETFTTASSTGLVNFLLTLLESGSSLASPFPQAGSPTRPDATYVTNSIVTIP